MGHCTLFACPTSRTDGQPDAASAPSHGHGHLSRPSLLKFVVSLLVCCWGSRHSHSSGDSDAESEEGIELGPMTLREYIATLQPYDPEVHGWRGDEPRRAPKGQNAHLHVQANGKYSPLKFAYSSVSYYPRKRNSQQSMRNQVV